MKGQVGASRRNKSENPPAQDNQATKARLLRVATKLFAQKGFHGVSTREITQQAKVNLSSLYFHWRSKENLYLAAYGNLFQRLAALSQEFFALLEQGHPPAFLFGASLSSMVRVHVVLTHAKRQS